MRDECSRATVIMRTERARLTTSFLIDPHLPLGDTLFYGAVWSVNAAVSLSLSLARGNSGRYLTEIYSPIMESTMTQYYPPASAICAEEVK